MAIQTKRELIVINSEAVQRAEILPKLNITPGLLPTFLTP